MQNIYLLLINKIAIKSKYSYLQEHLYAKTKRLVKLLSYPINFFVERDSSFAVGMFISIA